MSIKVMTTVWESKLECTRKFVMLYYADRGNDEGENIWPSVATVAERASLDERTVQRITKSLVQDGLLAVAGSGPKGTNKYKINLEMVKNYGQEPSQQDAGGDSTPGGGAVPGVALSPKRGGAVPGGVALSPKRGGAVPPEPLLTITEPSLTVNCVDAKNFDPQPDGAAEIWQQARYLLEINYPSLKQFPQKRVLDNVCLLGLDGDKFSITTRDLPAADILAARYGEVIKQTLVGILGRSVELEIGTLQTA